MSRWLLDPMSVLRIRRAAAMLLEASLDAAKRGAWLEAEHYAKDAIAILNAVWRTTEGDESGVAILREPHRLARGVTEKRFLGRAGRLNRLARALIARELERAGRHKRERAFPYYDRPEHRRKPIRRRTVSRDRRRRSRRSW